MSTSIVLVSLAVISVPSEIDLLTTIQDEPLASETMVLPRRSLTTAIVTLALTW